MTVRAVREALQAQVQAVPDVGVVHAFERFATNMVGLKNFYLSPAHGDIRGWFIRPERIVERGIHIPRWLEVITWQLRGVMGWNDASASDLVFSDLVEGVRDGIRADLTLGGTVTKCGLLQADAERGVQVDDYGPVMFAGVLCHGVRIRLTTTRERTQ